LSKVAFEAPLDEACSIMLCKNLPLNAMALKYIAWREVSTIWHKMNNNRLLITRTLYHEIFSNTYHHF
jgi:hypothetical protein